MSIEVLEPEWGDDRDPDVMIQRLEEMFGQPTVAEPIYDLNVNSVSAGDYTPVATECKRGRHRFAGLGSVAVRRIHTRPSVVLPDSYS